jgi:adenine-specific DNA-methyltransferase
MIAFRTAAIQNTSTIQRLYDYAIWYCRDRSSAKINTLYRERTEEETESTFDKTELDGSRYKAAQLKTKDADVLKRLKLRNRLTPDGRYFKRLPTDFPYVEMDSVWTDTVMSTFSKEKVYAVQTMSKVVERCVLLTTIPGDLVMDITCGSGTTAYCAEKWGRRWVTCDSSRVATNIARHRLLAAVYPHYRMKRNAEINLGFVSETVARMTQTTIGSDKEPEIVEIVDRPEVVAGAIRVTGPFEILSVGRYSAEDWRGQVVSTDPETGRAALANYITVIAQLYRKGASVEPAAGMIHATAEDGDRTIAISVGPITGRVTAKQINDVVQDALAAGLLEVHVLGWAFEANVGEIKSQLEKRGKVKIELIMIRPDTLAEGLKVTRPEQLFSPLALPKIELTKRKDEYVVSLEGVAVFDRRTRATDYKPAKSGYVSAWYLDHDYDGDCFVDCQMFFDFKKAPNLRATLKIDVDPEEYKLQLESQPFKAGEHKRIAVKVVDVYGNESTVVRELT